MLKAVGSLFAPPGGDQVAAEQVEGLYKSAPVGVLSALFATGILCWVLIHTDPALSARMLGWLAATTAIAAAQLILWWLYRRAKPAAGSWRLWAALFCATCFFEGCRFAYGAICLATPGSVVEQLWLLLVICTAIASSVSSLGSYTPAFYASLAPATAPFAIWSACQGDTVHWVLSILDGVLAFALAMLGFEQGRSLAEALRLKFENIELARDLIFQKERAEAANSAKTTFLAAASHDLRQPLHAMGLFLDALQGRRMDAAARRLTAQVNESLRAMDGLFNALLDISSLDAGVTKRRDRVFRVQPLLERIGREFALQARAKNLGLTVMPCSLAVRTDPILLEEMLRNIVSNAVRHTQRGRILVGCRRSGRGGAGQRLTIGVWDTGPGIATEDQGKIFEEFFQLSNPERDRRNGLGLGLAITKRLAELLDCPLELRSQPGKGSAFLLAAPTAVFDARAEIAGEPNTALGSGAGRVLVIDDEISVQEAMRASLESWGYDVVTAEAAEDALQRLGERQPDLMFCDWRLRDHQTGGAVVEAIREAFGATIPAVLITGDTTPALLQQINGTGLTLLHKPVVAGKLRATAANLIRPSAARAA
jgi:signal transduction histidine kinase/CheY-like chemotaxis protein